MKNLIICSMILFAACLFAGVTHADLTDGLVGHWTFDNNAQDSSGNNHHGLTNNGVAFVLGVIGQAAYFDGVDDHIFIPHDPQLNLTDTVSISGFFKSRNYERPSRVSLVEKWTGVTGYPYAVRLEPTNGDLALGVYDTINAPAVTST